MEFDIEMLKKDLDGKILAENKNGQIVCEMRGSSAALALIIATMEEKILEAFNMSDEEWENLRKVFKRFAKSFGDFQKVEIRNEK